MHIEPNRDPLPPLNGAQTSAKSVTTEKDQFVASSPRSPLVSEKQSYVPDMVARGKQLLENVEYPPLETVGRIAILRAISSNQQDS